MIHPDYPYLYETHLHTSQGSACAHNTGYEMAKAAHEFGYAGIIVTDHNWGGNTAVDRGLPWEDWVYRFAEGYRDARRYADEYDNFDVFFGYEAGFNATEFLIYGISPEWMAAHPQLREMNLEEHLRFVRNAGGMAIHAHPFREERYIPQIRLFPELVDGVESVNANHSCSRRLSRHREEYDQRAIAYAREHSLFMSAGSDMHSHQLLGGGVALKHRLHSIEDFCNVIQTKQDHLLCNGDAFFDAQGVILK